MFLAQIETSERVVKNLTDQVYNQPLNWFVTAACIALLGFCSFLLLRAFRQADKTSKEKNDLQDIVLRLSKESVEALTQVKMIVSDLRTLMSADVEATRSLTEKIGEQNGEIKSIARELTNRRRSP
jgi:vacuolar-type H+-ATPase subunit I/STV1